VIEVKGLLGIMKKVLSVVISVLFVASANVVGGRTLVLGQESPVAIVKPVVNESGWKIPGLEESQITSPRKMLQKGYGPSSVPLYVTVFRPTQQFITTIPLYRLKNDQSLIIVERKVVIDSIIKCDVDGRAFVYILQCTIILEEPGGRTGYSGQFGVHYSDRDGDGKFESFQEGPPFVTPDLQIPAWVLKNP
jgi:hypothetical protein